MRKWEADILRAAVYSFGEDHQKRKAIEELSELIKELCKDLDGKGKPELIADEMADVGIMMDQLVLIYENEDDVAEHRKAKLDRLENTVFNSIFEKGGP